MTAKETDIPVLPFVEEPAAPDTLNVLLYGPPGSGKTTAAATAPGPVMWLNAEGGNALAYARKTARERGTRLLELRLDPKETNVKQMLGEAYLYVKKHPEIRTVVVDTLAKVRESLVQQIGGDTPKIQDWGAVAKILKDFVKSFRDLPVNLVLIAHEDVSDDAEAGRIVTPLIGGTLNQIIPGEVDVVAYCRAFRTDEGVRYRGRLVETRGCYAKDRSGGLGEARDLDLTEWLGAFRHALGTDGDPFLDLPAEAA